jgi:hypothetical protein
MGFHYAAHCFSPDGYLKLLMMDAQVQTITGLTASASLLYPIRIVPWMAMLKPE